MSEPTERPELHPSFWPHFEDTGPVSRAIQMPMNDLVRWANGVFDAIFPEHETEPS